MLAEQRNRAGEMEIKAKGCSRQERGNKLPGAVAAAQRAWRGVTSAPRRAWPWELWGVTPRDATSEAIMDQLPLVNHLPIRKHSVVSAKRDLCHLGAAGSIPCPDRSWFCGVAVLLADPAAESARLRVRARS